MKMALMKPKKRPVNETVSRVRPGRGLLDLMAVAKAMDINADNLSWSSTLLLVQMILGKRYGASVVLTSTYVPRYEMRRNLYRPKYMNQVRMKVTYP
jgi:hypothetical protein